MYRIALATALWLIGWSQYGSAQQIPDTILTSLSQDNLVRLHLAGGERIESRIQKFNTGDAWIHLAQQRASLPAASVDSLWVRRSAAATGAVVGAIVLAIPAGLLAAYIAWADNEANPNSDAPAVIAGVVIGAGVGALIGAAIGSGIKRWQLHWGRSRISLEMPGSAMGATLRLAF